MTRVTILNQYFYPDNVTSATLTYELACGLAKNGYDVKAVAGMPYEYQTNTSVARREIKNNIEINRIDYSSYDRSSKIGRIRNYFSFFWAIKRNKKLLKNTDVLITYSSPPINPILPAIYRKKYGYKMVNVIYDLYPDLACNFGYMKPNGLSQKILIFINDFVYKKCDKIVVLSQEMKQYFIDHKGHADKVSVIPNWYNDDHGQADDIAVDTKRLSVLYGGNIGIVQDTETLALGIDKFKNRDDIEFIFATHGNKQDEFFNRLDSMGVNNYKRLGLLEKHDYDKLLKTVDIGIVAADEKIIGLASPSKFYAYIAKSLPVLFIGPQAMDVAKDITGNSIGYVVANGKIEQFVRAIEDFQATHKEEKLKMRQRARELFYTKYTLIKCLDKYDILLKELNKEIKNERIFE